MTKQRWGILAVFVLAIALLIYTSWPSAPKVVDSTATINAAQAQMQTQFTNQLKEKDVQIKDYQSRLAVSDAKYKTLALKYNDLQKEKEHVKAPLTNAETRTRFTAAGFAPLPVK
jgi:predicted PurR-regulated permease PerM